MLVQLPLILSAFSAVSAVALAKAGPFCPFTYLPPVNILNIEIKARCTDPDRIREILKSRHARYIGRDHQIDTYYRVQNGRLKLRQGNIENALIAYSRENISGPKASSVVLYKTQDALALKAALDTALPLDIIVDKMRDIYFIEHVKFHVDEVKGLGAFVEIEAIDDSGDRGAAQLRQDCFEYLKLLSIADIDLLTHSYSDMIMHKNQNEK